MKLFYKKDELPENIGTMQSHAKLTQDMMAASAGWYDTEVVSAAFEVLANVLPKMGRENQLIAIQVLKELASDLGVVGDL